MVTKNRQVNSEQGTQSRKEKGRIFQDKASAHALETGILSAFGVSGLSDCEGSFSKSSL